MYNTRAELAIDRLKGQTDETARRQGEVEVKRREKVTYHSARRIDVLGVCWQRVDVGAERGPSFCSGA